MEAKISARGVVSHFVTDEVALFHAHSGAAPPSCAFDIEEHPVFVSGDIRLDNSDDIVRALGVPGGKRYTHAHLIRLAFLRWGPGSFERLIGDFAFAIWDGRDRSLYCCRDHFGVRPLFYQNHARSFAFASEAKILPSFNDKTFSDIYMASFLANIPYCSVDTSHPGIQRLLPGHWLRWQDGRLTVARYWELEIEEVRSPDPVEEFREHFFRSVRDRIGPPTRCASLLSGGLDSSAITAVAEKIVRESGSSAAFKTYSIVYQDSPSMDERHYIEDVLATGRYQSRLLDMDHYQPLKGMTDLLRVQEGPFNSPGLLRSTLVYRAAVKDGVEIVLHGHGGDEVVGYGTGRLWEYALAGKWLDLIPLTRTHSRLTGASSLQLYQQLLERYGSKHYHTRATRWLLRHLVRAFVRNNQQRITAWESYVLPSYADAMNLRERSRANLVLSALERTSDQHYQLKGLNSPLVGSGFEAFDKASAATGLEIRYPFYDVRLVQFCLGLDSSEKLRRNETRSILRRAMGDLYPASISKRQDKTNFMPELAVGLVRYHEDILFEMAKDTHGWLAQYLDMNSMRRGLEDFMQNPLEADGGDVLFFWRAVIVYLWMRRIDA
jgi:asparagine synthase (glutamine-hydrolysing)